MLNRRSLLAKKMLLLLAVYGLGIAGASAQTSFNRFNFNVGGGIGGAFGDVGKVTGKSYNGVIGAGMNLSRNFGVKAEYMYFDLGFKDQVKRDQHLLDASGHVQSATLNMFYNFSLNPKVGVYAIGGAGWYQRGVDARSQLLSAGTVCQPAWALWGVACTNGLVTADQTLASNGVDAGGYNLGGGFTFRASKRTKVYLEGRYHHAYTSDKNTTVFPVTVGLRW
jgi:opacity protein-like surface antigen